jgi:polyferredoxin
MITRMMKYFPKTISKKQATDTGMAFVLILLLIGLFSGDALYYKIAIPVLIINMIFPSVYNPMAVLWLGFSMLLGTVVSKFLLGAVYIVLVLPIGLIRRFAGKDSLQLKKFKKGNESVMTDRNYTFKAADIEQPY